MVCSDVSHTFCTNFLEYIGANRHNISYDSSFAVNNIFIIQYYENKIKEKFNVWY